MGDNTQRNWLYKNGQMQKAAKKEMQKENHETGRCVRAWMEKRKAYWWTKNRNDSKDDKSINKKKLQEQKSM